MNPTMRKALFPLPAALFVALSLAASPAAADPGHAHAEVRIHADGSFDVVSPLGWECTAGAPGVGGPAGESSSGSGGSVLELSCVNLSLGVPVCGSGGTVIAGVNQQTGTLGETTAIALCEPTGEASCNAYHADTPLLNQDCEVSVTGNGVAKCLFVTTVNVNYNRVGYCNVPLLF